MDIDTFDAVIALLYDAAAGHAQWPVALGAMTDLLGGFASTLLVWDNTIQRPVFQSMTDRFDPEAVRLYNEYYGALDRMRQLVPTYAVGQVANSAELINPEEVAKSEFHNDFLIPNGGRFLLGATLSNEPSATASIGIHRGTAQGAFEKADSTLLKRVIPHLARATAIFHRTLSLEAKVRLGQGALDLVPWLVILADAQARVLFMNEPAEAAVRTGDGFRLRGGKLVSSSAKGTEQLHHSIRRAVVESLDRSSGQASSVVVPRREDRGSYAALIARLPRALEGLLANATPAVMIVATDPLSQAMPPEGMLRQLYGLTTAEARVAVDIANGLTIDEIAMRCGVGRETIRTQMKAVFGKTDCRRQAEVASLLARLPNLPNR
jgi:DNA-binding CsgD family transcriptional regulator